MTLIKVRKTFIWWAKVPAALIFSQWAIGFALHLFPVRETLPHEVPWYNHCVFFSTVTFCFSATLFALFAACKEEEV